MVKTCQVASRQVNCNVHETLNNESTDRDNPKISQHSLKENTRGSLKNINGKLFFIL